MEMGISYESPVDTHIKYQPFLRSEKKTWKTFNLVLKLCVLSY